MYSPVLFAARSTKGVTRLSPTERASIKLPDKAKEVLIGIGFLLGDAHIRGIVVKRLVLFGFYCFTYFLTFYRIYVNFANLKVVYYNPKVEKATILKGNKGKSGIYL